MPSQLLDYFSILALGVALSTAACTRFDTRGISLTDDAGGIPDSAPADVNPGGDEDNDGVSNASDNCVFDANPDQEDGDSDSIGDACDNCPGITNIDQADVNSDGTGDACQDSDGDTVLDANDNCWNVANGPGDLNNQGDEDGDTLGDVCDNCPTVGNPGQEAVMDADPVGDACDPRPTMDGDAIAFFDGFGIDSPAGPPPGWAVSTGPENAAGIWSTSEGKLRQDTAGNAVPTIITRNTDGPQANGVWGNVLVTTSVAVGAFAGTDSPHIGLIAAYTDIAASNDSGYHCNLEKQTQNAGGATQLRITEFEIGNSATATVDTFTMAGGATPIYRLDHYQYWDGATNTTTCQAIDTANGMVYSMTRNFAGPSTGRVGLTTQQVTASFDYIIVYSLGGPLTCTPPARCAWP